MIRVVTFHVLQPQSVTIVPIPDVTNAFRPLCFECDETQKQGSKAPLPCRLWHLAPKPTPRCWRRQPMEPTHQICKWVIHKWTLMREKWCKSALTTTFRSTWTTDFWTGKKKSGRGSGSMVRCVKQQQLASYQAGVCTKIPISLSSEATVILEEIKLCEKDFSSPALWGVLTLAMWLEVSSTDLTACWRPKRKAYPRTRCTQNILHNQNKQWES